MDKMKIAAIVLMVVGVFGLAYGGFTFTENTHQASIGSMTFLFAEQRHVNVPVWAGIGMLLVGGLIMVASPKRG